MAIYDTNPDLPIPGQPFQLYQCPEVRNNPANQAQAAWWYNGQSLTPTVPPTLAGGNQMAFGGFGSYGQPNDSRRYDAPAQPMAMPQQIPQQQFGFNQLAESRRNAPAQPQIQTVGSTQNPWAVQTTAAPVQTANPHVAAMMPQLSPHLSFDRASAWGEQPSSNVPIPPQINWGAQPQQTAQQQQQMVAPVYPAPQNTLPPVQNWEAIAAENWAKK